MRWRMVESNSHRSDIIAGQPDVRYRNIRIVKRVKRGIETHQFPKSGLSLLVNGANPFIDSLLLLFLHFRVGTLLETLEDLPETKCALVSQKSPK